MYDIYEPKSVILKKYISEITILKKEKFEPINYLAFPHTISSIIFYSRTKIKFDKESITISKVDKNNKSIGVLGKYTTPLLLSYKDAVDEIAINFTEIGINYFFEDNYDMIGSNPFQVLKNKEWSDFSEQLFEIKDKNRIDILEKFLLSQIKAKDLNQIEHIIEMMKNDLSIKISEIASSEKKSVKTINRLFHKYIGCSPITYKKIIRFRNSINMNNEQMNLTELCLSNEYYDSPHFTSEFKKLTSLNPRKFFKKLTKVDNREFPYIFR